MSPGTDVVVAEVGQPLGDDPSPSPSPSEAVLSKLCQLVNNVNIVTELDYGYTVDSIPCKEIPSKYERLDDVVICKWLLSVIGTHSGPREEHNIDGIVDTINELAPSTNWVHVMENLDHEDLSILDESAFNLLMEIYARACKEPFPLHAVCGSLWKNTDGQISFLKHAVSAPADNFSFSHCSRKLAFPDLGSPSLGNHAWYCLDLLEVLCQLAEVGDTVSVQLMLEDPLEHCPELLLVGLGHVNTEHNLLQQKVLSGVFSTVLKDAAKSNVVKYLWNINPRLTLRGFVDAHSDPNSLLRIVELCQDLEILFAVLDSAPFPFSIKLAAAASRKYHSHVKKWLSEKSVVCKGHFLEGCVNFLKEIFSSTPMEQSLAEVMNLYWGFFPLFVEVCQSHSKELVPSQPLDENSTVCFDSICNKLEEKVREMAWKYLFQPNCLDIVENLIAMLLKDQQLSKDLITKEEQKFSELKGQRWEYPDPIQPDVFKKEYGPVVHDLKTLSKSNDNTLKKMQKGLLKYFNGDTLLGQVNSIYNRNKTQSKKAAAIICEYNDYLSRFNIEISWLDGAGKQIEQIYGLLSGRAPVLAELAELRSHIRELNTRVCVLSKECPGNFYSHCEALDALAKLLVDIDISSKKLISLAKTAKDLCLRTKNQRTLLIEKFKYATRFFRTEELVKKESSEVRGELLGLKLELEQAKLCYNEMMDGFPELNDTIMNYERIIVDKAWSWRTRLLLGRYILGEMRKQGLDMCAFVSTVVMTESLNKRENACRSSYTRGQFRPKEFDIKLSERHLQDTVRDYCKKNKRKGSEKLDVCLERMIETGVVSESTYNSPDPEAMEYTRYHISEFEKMEPSHLDKAFHKLDDAKVLVGTFGITKGYFSLGPDDVYDVPANAVFETNAAGNKLTHAVVIVGYGMSPEGKAYYAYQNWYGPDWGNGGFGMVTCDSILQLYSAKLHPPS